MSRDHPVDDLQTASNVPRLGSLRMREAEDDHRRQQMRYDKTIDPGDGGCSFLHPVLVPTKIMILSRLLRRRGNTSCNASGTHVVPGPPGGQRQAVGEELCLTGNQKCNLHPRSRFSRRVHLVALEQRGAITADGVVHFEAMKVWHLSSERAILRHSRAAI